MEECALSGACCEVERVVEQRTVRNRENRGGEWTPLRGIGIEWTPLLAGGKGWRLCLAIGASEEGIVRMYVLSVCGLWSGVGSEGVFL